MTYDKEGRLVKQVDENEEAYFMTQTWDGYDEQGNWTISTITNSWRRNDKEEPRSKNVLRRSITYRQVSNKRSLAKK